MACIQDHAILIDDFSKGCISISPQAYMQVIASMYSKRIASWDTTERTYSPSHSVFTVSLTLMWEENQLMSLQTLPKQCYLHCVNICLGRTLQIK